MLGGEELWNRPKNRDLDSFKIIKPLLTVNGGSKKKPKLSANVHIQPPSQLKDFTGNDKFPRQRFLWHSVLTK